MAASDPGLSRPPRSPHTVHYTGAPGRRFEGLWAPVDKWPRRAGRAAQALCGLTPDVVLCDSRCAHLSGRDRPVERPHQRRADKMIRPWVLPGNEFTILDEVRLEIDSARGDVAPSYFQRIDHMEVHAAVEDLLLDPLFLAVGEDRHLIAGILPAL